MQCRYCGKELALLKRLTGGGGFCSEAHKQSYQDEYNQLALSRLLQAQKKGETDSFGKKTGTPVAVEEPVAEEPVLEEHDSNAPETESAPLEIISLGASVAEDAVARDARIRYGQPPDVHVKTGAEPDAEPLEMADFLIDSPAVAVQTDEPPHLESGSSSPPGRPLPIGNFKTEPHPLQPRRWSQSAFSPMGRLRKGPSRQPT